jgi:DUF971 family protein
MAAQTLRPVSLSKEGDNRLVIEWNDGHRSVLAWAHIRKNCPCAGCREERNQPVNPLRILKPNEIGPLKPVSFTPIGHYAYKIVWSDGHDSGLFTLEHLRALCQCPDCVGNSK